MSMSEVESRTGAVTTLRSLRLPSPLIKPDVRISRIRLSDRLHCRLTATRGRAFAMQYSFLGSLRILSVLSGSSPITHPRPLQKARLKQGSFPPPALPGFNSTMTLSDSHRVRIAAAMVQKLHPEWVSHVARITFPTCRAHYPGGPDGGCRSSFPSVLPSPVSAGRHPQLHFRGLLRLHSHSAHRIARPPKAAFVTRLQPRQLPGEAARQLPACRLLSGWILPPLVIRAFVAHRGRSLGWTAPNGIDVPE
jgi:hypothetical protein